MSDNNAIEWTDATWPIVVGCDKVSEGCRGCYAIRSAHRMAGNPNPKVSGVYQGLTRTLPDGSLNWTGAVKGVAVGLSGETYCLDKDANDARCPDNYWPVIRLGKRRAGRKLAGRTWDEMPAVGAGSPRPQDGGAV